MVIFDGVVGWGAYCTKLKPVLFFVYCRFNMSLREKQSAARRLQMLDAAELLIRQSGGIDFSMRDLAKAAEVSPATPYNFFGSKEGLLFGLLTRNLQPFMKEAFVFSSDDPIEQVLEAAENAVNILVRDPVFLRPLYQVMLSLRDPIHHPEYIKNTFTFYRIALNGAVKHKLFTNGEDLESLAISLMGYFMGIMDLWIHEDIQEDLFRAQIIHGFSHLLWPIASGKSLKILQQKHNDAKKVLSKRQLKPLFIT